MTRPIHPNRIRNGSVAGCRCVRRGALRPLPFLGRPLGLLPRPPDVARVLLLIRVRDEVPAGRGREAVLPCGRVPSLPDTPVLGTRAAMMTTVTRAPRSGRMTRRAYRARRNPARPLLTPPQRTRPATHRALSIGPLPTCPASTPAPMTPGTRDKPGRIHYSCSASGRASLLAPPSVVSSPTAAQVRAAVQDTERKILCDTGVAVCWSDHAVPFQTSASACAVTDVRENEPTAVQLAVRAQEIPVRKPPRAELVGSGALRGVHTLPFQCSASGTARFALLT